MLHHLPGARANAVRIYFKRAALCFLRAEFCRGSNAICVLQTAVRRTSLRYARGQLVTLPIPPQLDLVEGPSETRAQAATVLVRYGP
jgi:hypothetical protein